MEEGREGGREGGREIKSGLRMVERNIIRVKDTVL